MKTYRFITAINHCIERIGLNNLLQQSYINCDITNTKTISELYNSVSKNNYDIVYMNYFFRQHSSLTLTPELIKFNPKIKIFVLSDYEVSATASRVISVGAKGFLSGDFEPDKLIEATNIILEGKTYLNYEDYIKNLTSQPLKQKNNPFDLLSNKEMEIVQYLKMGYSTSLISEKSRLAMSTVSTYKNRIFNKLKIDNLISLIELSNSYSKTLD